MTEKEIDKKFDEIVLHLFKKGWQFVFIDYIPQKTKLDFLQDWEDELKAEYGK